MFRELVLSCPHKVEPTFYRMETVACSALTSYESVPHSHGNESWWWRSWDWYKLYTCFQFLPPSRPRPPLLLANTSLSEGEVPLSPGDARWYALYSTKLGKGGPQVGKRKAGEPLQDSSDTQLAYSCLWLLIVQYSSDISTWKWPQLIHFVQSWYTVECSTCTKNGSC